MNIKLKLPSFSQTFFLFVMLLLIAVLLPDSGRTAEPCLISLEVFNETLEKTLGRISEISGYSIELQSEKKDLLVSAKIVDVPLENVFSKLLGNGVNHAIIWNEKEKKILITIMDSSPEIKESNGIEKKNLLKELGRKFEQLSRTTN